MPCACWRHTGSSETQLVYYIQRNEEGVGFITQTAEGGGRLANLGRRSLEGGAVLGCSPPGGGSCD